MPAFKYVCYVYTNNQIRKKNKLHFLCHMNGIALRPPVEDIDREKKWIMTSFKMDI